MIDPIVRQLIDLREAQDLTRVEVAKRAGLAPSTIYQVEIGQNGITLATLRLWSAALGVVPVLKPKDQR